ncbi:choline ABC transporter ATP-binding protein [Oceanobacillus sp. E9]|uniref:ABC transporter ATP-binding protein n=1 Tax=Oceanobacillus TaxID=182709 RepID=UPI00084E670F|nr:MULTISPECIES: ABC transporter ATP-binding protein [Oceanobacillus]OEH55865.1 choline ABC transporter ATP-binding protein [Oceanobacillus sp. E9]
MITFKDIKKTYPDGTTAVSNFNLQIKQGELVTLIGPSGCGKTTTMKMINRLIDPTEGYIYINDKPVSDYSIHELRWNIGYVLQQIALFPHMTVRENVAIVPELRKWKKKKIDKRIDELLTMVGMEPAIFRDRYPSELSGGQQQRIGVIRALAADPEIILMDEPFSALDPISREQLQEDILKLQKEIKKTIVFVTHDMDEAIKLADRICLMKDGEVVQVGTPQQLMKSQEKSFVQEFMGDYQSPWVMNVKELVSQDSKYTMITAPTNDYSEVLGFKVLLNEDSIFQGVIQNGKVLEEPITIPENATIEESSALMQGQDQSRFPVLDENEKLVGIVSSQAIVQYLYEQEKSRGGIPS